MKDTTRSAWGFAVAAVPGLLPDVDPAAMDSVASVAPIFAERAAGARFHDSEGREYIDYVMGWGAVILGHSHPAVAEAVHTRLSRGTLFSIASTLPLEVAERLIRRIPCAEQVYFGKNGSDACTVAARIARVATGRDGIAVCEGHYHGFHDWFACSVSHAKGIPSAFAEFIHRFSYNDLHSLARLLKKRGTRIAAVMLEPVRDHEPAPGYLDEVAHLARRHGCLLIFDEMVTGFRLASGGAQELYRVIPDLACFGKSVANGLPLSFVCGPKNLMRHAPNVFAQMTLQYEQLSLAAARGVLDELDRIDLPAHLWRVGGQLRDGLLRAAAARGVEMIVPGPAPRLSCWFSHRDPAESKRRLTYFLQGLMSRGVFSNGNFLPSAAHGEREIQTTLDRADQALADLADAIRQGDLARRIQFPFDIV